MSAVGASLSSRAWIRSFNCAASATVKLSCHWDDRWLCGAMFWVCTTLDGGWGVGWR